MIRLTGNPEFRCSTCARLNEQQAERKDVIEVDREIVRQLREFCYLGDLLETEGEVERAVRNVIEESLCSNELQPVLNMSDLDSRYPNRHVLPSSYKEIYYEYNSFRSGLSRSITTWVELTGDDLNDTEKKNNFKDWQMLWLNVFGSETCAAQYFPKTLQIVRDSGLPVLGIMISRLGPNSTIPPHLGLVNIQMRYHLGLEVVEQGPRLNMWSTFDTNQNGATHQRIYWGEGEEVYFDDTFLHSAVNPTPHERVVLWLDIARTDFRGWRESFWGHLLYKAIEISPPPPLVSIVAGTEPLC